MTTRHSLIRSAALLICSTFLPTAAYAQTPAAKPAPAPAVKPEAEQPTYYGMLNDDNVFVRSGPSEERYYATARLNKGAKVTVVGTVNVAKEDWLKIIPPEGSYCYVARAYVEKRGDGSVGRVTKADLNVRAGSSLNSLKTTVQTSLEEGDDVKIMGEETDYFRIAPPPGAYLWVKKNFVDPMPQLASSMQQPTVLSAPAPRMNYPIASEPVPPVVSATPAPALAPPLAPPLAPSPAPVPASAVTPTPVAVAPATQPAQPVLMAAVAPPATQPVMVAAVPATQPVVAAAPSVDEKFDMLESSFLAANKLPLDQQPISKLLEQYNAISSDAGLSSSIRRIADRRVATLKVRSTAQQDLLQTLSMKKDNDARFLSIKVENEELTQRVKDNQVTMFAALGTLRMSSLQQTNGTLYRLTDPNTGRTLLYVKSNDPKYAEMLNKFVGVNGDINEDTNLNLKVISPKSTEEVDPSKVNTKISATVIPPSLLLKASTASADGN